MANLPEAMKLITGTEPTPEQIQRVQAIAHSLDMSMKDAMFPILVALDQYHGIYTRLPGEVAASTKDLTTAAANNAATQAQAAVNKAVAALVPSVEQAVSKAAANAVNRVGLGISIINIWWGLASLGVAFALGWVAGGHVFSEWQNGKITLDNIWHMTDWGLGIGLVAPTLIIGGLVIKDEYGKPGFMGWSAFVVGISLAIFLELKLFGIVH